MTMTITVEELEAMRDEFDERARRAEAERDELEWSVRMELAHLREAELGARRSADDMRAIAARIEHVLVGPSAPRRATLPPLPPRRLAVVKR